MIIDGKQIAEDIVMHLALDVETLRLSGVTPTLAVILVGDNPASLAYIKQKQKAAQRIGAQILFDHQPESITVTDLKVLINRYNADRSVHGLIVQRPVPKRMGDASAVLASVAPDKDVDGFLSDSPYDVPVALAVGEILRHVHGLSDSQEKNYSAWIRAKKIVVIGKGETAGAPILRYLEKQHCATFLIHSKTANPQELMKKADIIISCVGRNQVVPLEAVSRGAILISVGIWRDTEGKLRGDYEEGDIADVASWYTPTPGGVGPINVACLMQNLVKACMMNTKEERL